MKDEKESNLKDWKDKISVMVLVKQEIQRLDKMGIWPHYLPEIAAIEEQLASAEKYLGHSIDKDYREFLMCANGWKGFLHTIDLFGTGDLIGSSLMDYVLRNLDVMDDAAKLSETSGFLKEELLPIAATREDIDLFVITRETSSHPGIVIWFAGGEVEKFPNFKEFF